MVKQDFINGWISGMSAIIFSHPLDTIKTNIQEKKIINYNFKSLYKGILPPLIGVGFEKAIVFGVYESTINHTKNNAISGGLSGMAASFIVTPFERIKILLQTNQGISSINPRYLFQGLSSTFYRETPGFAIYFSVYNYLKNNKEINPIQSFIYGGLSGSIAWIFIYPQDRIKTHVQALQTKKMGFIEGFKEILKDGGYKGLYRGFHFALMRAIPLHACAFTTMELCKKYL